MGLESARVARLAVDIERVARGVAGPASLAGAPPALPGRRPGDPRRDLADDVLIVEPGLEGAHHVRRPVAADRDVDDVRGRLETPGELRGQGLVVIDAFPEH